MYSKATQSFCSLFHDEVVQGIGKPLCYHSNLQQTMLEEVHKAE